MMKKTLLIILALIVVIAVPFSVFATTSDATAAKKVRGFFGIDSSKLTDSQKADITDYSKKMADLQKEFINKMISNGSMTKEQGDAAIKRIEEQEQNGGICMGKGPWGGFEGKRGDFGKGKIDTSKLTDQQKTDLADISKKTSDLQKQFINKMVANGLMTKEQGDTATKRADDMAKNLENKGMFMGRGGFGGFGFMGMGGVNTSNLTDQQKADFADFLQKMNDLEKESINKMVANGLMTKEQGDAAIKRIDDMQKSIKENGLPNGMKMQKGRFGGHGRQGNFKMNDQTQSSDKTTTM